MPESGPFHWAPEQDQFRGVVRKLAAEHAPLACARSPLSDEPHDRELWRACGDELGLPGLVVPEEHGGAGFSRLDLAITAVDLGRVVVSERPHG